MLIALVAAAPAVVASQLGAPSAHGAPVPFTSDPGAVRPADRSAVVPPGPQYAPIGSFPVDAGPVAIAYDGGVGQTFVADYSTYNVTVYSDAQHRVVANIPVLNAFAIVYDSGKGEVFVTTFDTSFGPAPTIQVISDVTDSIVATLTVGTSVVGHPHGPAAGLAYDPAKGMIYATLPQNGTVLPISDATNRFSANISVGTSPDAIAYDPVMGELFVANQGSDNVSVISDVSNHVVATVPVGSEPSAIAYDAAASDVLVVNSLSNNVTVISDATNRVVANIPVGTNPTGVAVAGGTFFVSNGDSHNVTVVLSSGAHESVSFPSINFPDALAYDTGEQVLLVADSGIQVTWFVTEVYPVSFSETGLPAGTFWALTLSGTTPYSVVDQTMGTTSYALLLQEPRGSYTFVVEPPFGFVVGPSSGVVLVDGISAAGAVITFAPLYQVVFVQTTLPTGTNWSVTLEGSTLSTTGHEIAFSVPNGTYDYLVGPVPWYSASPPSGAVTVAGGNAGGPIAFTPAAPPPPGPPPVQVSISGYTSANVVAIAIGAVGLALGLVALVLVLRGRPPAAGNRPPGPAT